MCKECHISISPIGTVLWIDDEGLLHCLDGPSAILEDGTIGYFCHGKFHRVGGPAIIWLNGNVQFWLNGVRVRAEDV